MRQTAPGVMLDDFVRYCVCACSCAFSKAARRQGVHDDSKRCDILSTGDEITTGEFVDLDANSPTSSRKFEWIGGGSFRWATFSIVSRNGRGAPRKAASYFRPAASARQANSFETNSRGSRREIAPRQEAAVNHIEEGAASYQPANTREPRSESRRLPRARPSSRTRSAPHA